MFSFKIKPDGGDEFALTASSRDVFVWEKSGRGRSFGNQLAENLSMQAMYELAHVAAKRQQVEPVAGMSLTEFVESCDLSSEEDPEPDPTQRDHLRGE